MYAESPTTNDFFEERREKLLEQFQRIGQYRTKEELIAFLQSPKNPHSGRYRPIVGAHEIEELFQGAHLFSYKGYSLEDILRKSAEEIVMEIHAMYDLELPTGNEFLRPSSMGFTKDGDIIFQIIKKTGDLWCNVIAGPKKAIVEVQYARSNDGWVKEYYLEDTLGSGV